MYPVVGAGDFFENAPPAGAGDFLDLPFNIGAGAGGVLPNLFFSVQALNNVVIQQDGCRILRLSPIETWSDRSFVVAQDENLCLVTPLTPGGSYSVRVMRVDPTTEADLFESDAVLDVPPNITDPDGVVVASKLPAQFALLESLTFAIGKMVQSIGGRPSCRVATDCAAGSTVLLVNSTLGFPRSGSLEADGGSYSYVDKCDTAFVLSQPLFFPLATGDLLISDVKSIPPRRPQ